MVAASAGRLCLEGRGWESRAGDRHLPLRWSPGSRVPLTPKLLSVSKDTAARSGCMESRAVLFPQNEELTSGQPPSEHSGSGLGEYLESSNVPDAHVKTKQVNHRRRIPSHGANPCLPVSLK